MLRNNFPELAYLNISAPNWSEYKVHLAMKSATHFRRIAVSDFWSGLKQYLLEEYEEGIPRAYESIRMIHDKHQQLEEEFRWPYAPIIDLLGTLEESLIDILCNKGFGIEQSKFFESISRRIISEQRQGAKLFLHLDGDPKNPKWLLNFWPGLLLQEEGENSQQLVVKDLIRFLKEMEMTAIRVASSKFVTDCFD